LEPECVVLEGRKNLIFQQGQLQTDVLEALLVRGQVGAHLKCSKTVKESVDADTENRSTGVPVRAVKAYRGEEVQVHFFLNTVLGRRQWLDLLQVSI